MSHLFMYMYLFTNDHQIRPIIQHPLILHPQQKQKLNVSKFYCFKRFINYVILSHINRSRAVFRSKGSHLNLKDLLQMYVIMAVGACVLCQFKVCCDVQTRRNRDSNTWIYCTVLFHGWDSCESCRSKGFVWFSFKSK